MPANLTSKLILAAALAWTQVLQLGPYVAGGILLAAVLGQLDLPRRWGRWLGRSGPGTVLGAACLGGVSPLAAPGAGARGRGIAAQPAGGAAGPAIEAGGFAE
jgi:hypothetical protein